MLNIPHSLILQLFPAQLAATGNFTMANIIPFVQLAILASACISQTYGNQSLIEKKLDLLERKIEELTQNNEARLSRLESKSSLCSK